MQSYKKLNFNDFKKFKKELWKILRIINEKKVVK